MVLTGQAAVTPELSRRRMVGGRRQGGEAWKGEEVQV